MSRQQTPKAKVQQLMCLGENRICADCHSKDPKWASTTLGEFICLTCSGIHRGLGTHITFVRSCTLDEWNVQQVAVMEKVGNTKANAYWEANLPPNFDRPTVDNVPALERFIQQKYVQKKWINSNTQPPHLATNNERSHGSHSKHSTSQRASSTNHTPQFSMPNPFQQQLPAGSRPNAPVVDHNQQPKMINSGSYDQMQYYNQNQYRASTPPVAQIPQPQQFYPPQPPQQFYQPQPQYQQNMQQNCQYQAAPISQPQQQQQQPQGDDFLRDSLMQHAQHARAANSRPAADLKSMISNNFDTNEQPGFGNTNNARALFSGAMNQPRYPGNGF